MLSIAVLSFLFVIVSSSSKQINWLWLVTIQTAHPTNDETGVFLNKNLLYGLCVMMYCDQSLSPALKFP